MRAAHDLIVVRPKIGAGHATIHGRPTDTGFGIPPNILPRLFEPFVTHGKPHGTGLGLAIAKSVMEAHKGKISISSMQGSGTTVEIRLPAPASPVAK